LDQGKAAELLSVVLDIRRTQMNSRDVLEAPSAAVARKGAEADL
jgi:hypothetical protein